MRILKKDLKINSTFRLNSLTKQYFCCKGFFTRISNLKTNKIFETLISSKLRNNV
jgi:hypothetical protein